MNKIAFFGTPTFAVTILDELKKAGFVPALVVTAPDKPQGRGLTLTPPPVKVWAQTNDVKFIQPTDLKDSTEIAELLNESWDLFIVAAYGKIIPENILNIPAHKTLNVHPSLLPKYRGPSPIESAILNNDQEIGVSIMRLDKEMDHGPIVAQEKIPTPTTTPTEILKINKLDADKARVNETATWPIPAPTLENIAAHFGGALLAKIIPDWIAGKITEKEQDHANATYCKKTTKADGLIDLDADPYTNYLKICAYSGWPGAYFFKEIAGNKNADDRTGDKTGSKKIRVSIRKATFKEGQLIIETVVPEGKSEMPYLDFLRGIK